MHYEKIFSSLLSLNYNKDMKVLLEYLNSKCFVLVHFRDFCRFLTKLYLSRNISKNILTFTVYTVGAKSITRF